MSLSCPTVRPTRPTKACPQWSVQRHTAGSWGHQSNSSKVVTVAATGPATLPHLWPGGLAAKASRCRRQAALTATR
eukprot:2724787-Lingulodinium_polyedra.AAC.1